MYKSPTRPDPSRRVVGPRRLAVAAWLALTFGLTLASTAALAQKALPIRIESNTADLSQQSGTSTYTGNVVLTRGGLTLSGNRLVITRINDRGNVQAVLTGSPAHLDKQPDRDGDAVVTGHSEKIEYANNSSTVVLRGNAVVERGGDKVTGQVIRHNLDTERTQAEGGSGGNNSGRVRITIQPQSNTGS